MLVKFKQMEFMADQVGKTFDGVISGVSKWGIFVEISYSHAEGLVSYRDWETDRKSTRLNSSHITRSRMPSSA